MNFPVRTLLPDPCIGVGKYPREGFIPHHVPHAQHIHLK
jgi:hypothetical protein